MSGGAQGGTESVHSFVTFFIWTASPRFSATGTGYGYTEQGSAGQSEKHKAPETGKSGCEGEFTGTWQHRGQDGGGEKGGATAVVKVGPDPELPPEVS